MDGLQAELARALRTPTGDDAAALGVVQRLGELKGTPQAIRLVTSGPPEGGAPTWGGCLASALESQASQEHSAASASYWHILELLSDARGFDPSARQAFYSQFNDPALHAALLGAVAARGPWDVEVRRCLRNLARSHDLRRPLQQAVPALVADLLDDALAHESAAALCNLACHSENKERAVECGAVRQLVQRLARPRQSTAVAEDVVACLGVLTGGYEQGMASLFEVAATDGRQEVFGPLFACLEGESSPPLQCLVLDVVGGLCAASPQFKVWAVQETSLVKTGLPPLLRSDAADLRKAALEFTNLLLEADGFREVFQQADGVNALQHVLYRDRPQGEDASASNPFQFMAPGMRGGRREPTQRDLAQNLLSKILII